MDEYLQKLEILCARHASLKLHPLAITCGPGWFPLIDAALQELDRLKKLAPHLQFTFLQATEKFGALRLYIGVPNGTRADVEAVGALISQTEHRSKTVCERCGAAAAVREWAGWLSTRCTTCFENSIHNPPDEE